MMGDLVNRIVWWVFIRKIWGKRCADFHPRCRGCIAWAEFDMHMNGFPDITYEAILEEAK